MTPRLSALSRINVAPSIQSRIVLDFLTPLLSSQTRSASILSALSNTPGSYSHKKRVGRGPSSGKGKTAGRGYNGQKARGKTPFKWGLGKHFEGGQTPQEIVNPGPAYNRHFSVDLQLVSLGKISDWVSQKRLDPTRPITIRELHQSCCISRCKDGVKLLADGKEVLPPEPLHIITSRASAAAIAAVEAAGGKVSTRYYTPFAMRQIVRGKMDPVHSLQSRFDVEEWGPNSENRKLYRLPDPTSRKSLEYYRDPAHRGYLSWMVPEGHNPSLFFRTPGLSSAIKAAQDATPRKEKAKADDNKLF